MIPKDKYRNKIKDMFPSISDDEAEDVLNQVDETIHKYGAFRTMTIGEIVKKIMEDEFQKPKAPV